ncbi:MAG: hypothetical protein ABIJ57_01845 [Pseudomonadota bacterium]
MPTDPVWKNTNMRGEDVGNAAFSLITGASQELPPKYKMTVNEILAASDTPIGWNDFYLRHMQGDGVTVIKEYGPLRFWVDGFERANPVGLVFHGEVDNQDRNSLVQLWAVESTGALVPRSGTVLFRIESE